MQAMFAFHLNPATGFIDFDIEIEIEIDIGIFAINMASQVAMI